jgi:hypothetical protein
LWWYRLGSVAPSTDFAGNGQFLLSRLLENEYMTDERCATVVKFATLLTSDCSSMAVAALTFVGSGLYVNPSRFNPAHVTCRPGDYNCITLHNSNDNVIFLSTVVTNESHLTQPKKIGGAGLKYMAGIFHALEWERFASFFCMAFSAEKLVAQASH